MKKFFAVLLAVLIFASLPTFASAAGLRELTEDAAARVRSDLAAAEDQLGAMKKLAVDTLRGVLPYVERLQVSGADAPVELALTITPAGDADPGDGLVTYDWHLENLGNQSCRFEALRLSFGDEPDFRKDTLTVVIDGATLKPNGNSSASGSFTVAAGWGEGSLNFCALAEVERTGDLYDSNVVKY